MVTFMTLPLFLLLCATVSFASVAAGASIVSSVPNVRAVVIEGHRWHSLWTLNPRGGGGTKASGDDALNPFGAAFASNPSGWSTLCAQDSDGDGFTNGEELGDPDCVWTPGAVPSRTTHLSHPGLFGSIPDEAYPTRKRAAKTCLRDTIEPLDTRRQRHVTIDAPNVSLLLSSALARVVNVRKAGPDPHLPAENRSACPHKASGLSDWHSPTTWEGAGVPLAGSAVTIPAGKRVLASSCSFEPLGYAKITIPAGAALIFADAPIFLRVKDILIQGELLLGSNVCPLHSAVTITFVGEKMELAAYSNGIVATAGGAVRLHGSRNEWTWTRLAATVVPGTVYVFVQDAVGWGPGDEIVITTSIWKDLENDQNEVRTVLAVDASGKILVVDRPFGFKHYASVEYQTEVGLLTRSILLRGSSSDQSTRDKFGGHVMAVGEAAVLEAVGVRAHRMGQQNVLGRYPFHMHLLRHGGAASTLQQSTCEHCWYRCVSIHKTNHTLVRKNVAYDVSGHTFYLEDGGEMFNRVEYNLAAYIVPIGVPASGTAQEGETFDEDVNTAIQPADHTASGFYIPNPHNYVVGNAASGGWSGFSYPIFPYTMRLSADLGLNPSTYPVLEFDGNTAHSSGYFWRDAGCIYFGGQLTDTAARNLFTYSNGRFSHPTDGFHNITNLRVWLCQRGFSSWGKRVDVDRFEAHDIKRSAVLFGSSSIHNAIITGTTDNNPPDMRTSGKQGFGFYDTRVQTVLANVTFVNYWPQPLPTSMSDRDGVFTELTHSDQFKPWGISATRDVQFENVDTACILARWVRESGSSRMFNVVDWDGSLLQSPSCSPHIIGSEIDWWNVGSECFYRSDWPAYVCPRVPGREVVGLDMDLPGIMQELPERTNENDELTQEQRDRLYIGHISQWGSKSSRQLIITRNHHLATGLSGIGWYMFLKMGVPPVITITPKNFPTNGVYIVLAIPYPTGTTFDIWAVPRKGPNKTRFEEVATRARVIGGNGTSFAFVASEGLLYLKIGDWWSAYPNSYRRFGVDVYDVMESEVQIVVSASCRLLNAEGFCAAPASPNPPSDDGLLPVRVCGSLSEQTRKQVATDLCPTYSDILRPDLAATAPDCDIYIGPSTGRCPKLVSAGYCNATCAAACRVFNPYPYRCSFAEPCQTREFRPPPVGGQCSALVDRPNTLHKDVCFVKACVDGRLTQLRSPAGTPCDGEADAGTGSQWRCLGNGDCANASFYAAGEPSVRRVTDRTASGNKRLVEVLVDSLGHTIRHVTVILGGGGNTPLFTFAMQLVSGGGSGGLPAMTPVLYRYVHTGPVRRNVTIMLSTAPPPPPLPSTIDTGGVAPTTVVQQTRTFTFLDWARTAQLIPKVTPSVDPTTNAVTLQIEPIDWVVRAVFFPSVAMGPAAAIDLVCDSGPASACTLPSSNSAPTPATDAVVVLHLASRITVRRTLPCLLAALHANARCETPTVIVRRPHVPCHHMLVFFFGSSRSKYSLTVLEGDPAIIASVTAPGNKTLKRGSSGRLTTFSGSFTGSTAAATIIVVTLVGDAEVTETHILESHASAANGDALECESGFAPPPAPPDAGLQGYCTAGMPHVCDVNAVPPSTKDAAAMPTATTTHSTTTAQNVGTASPDTTATGAGATTTITHTPTTTDATTAAEAASSADATTTADTTSRVPATDFTRTPGVSTTTSSTTSTASPMGGSSTTTTSTTVTPSPVTAGPATDGAPSTAPPNTTQGPITQPNASMVLVFADNATTASVITALAAYLRIDPSRLQVVRPATASDRAALTAAAGSIAVLLTVIGSEAASHVATVTSMPQEALLALGLEGAAPAELSNITTTTQVRAADAHNREKEATPLTTVVLGAVGAVLAVVVATVVVLCYVRRQQNGRGRDGNGHHCSGGCHTSRTAFGVWALSGGCDADAPQRHPLSSEGDADGFASSSRPVLVLHDDEEDEQMNGRRGEETDEVTSPPGAAAAAVGTVVSCGFGASQPPMAEGSTSRRHRRRAPPSGVVDVSDI